MLSSEEDYFSDPATKAHSFLTPNKVPPKPQSKKRSSSSIKKSSPTIKEVTLSPVCQIPTKRPKTKSKTSTKTSTKTKKKPRSAKRRKETKTTKAKEPKETSLPTPSLDLVTRRLTKPPLSFHLAPPQKTLPAFVGHSQIKDKAIGFFEARSKSLVPKGGPALLLEGPPGNGKSLLIETLCRIYDFELAPLTSAKIGSWADLCYYMERVAFSTSLSGNSQCILVDHLDILVNMGASITKLGSSATKTRTKGGSGSKASDLAKMLKALPPHANPIVFTVSSLDSKPIRDFASSCLHLKTYGLTKGDLLNLTRKWLKNRNLVLSPTLYTRLVDEAFGDMRRLQNELHWATAVTTSSGLGKRSAGSSDILATAAARSLFASTSHIFGVTGNPAKNLARSNILFGLDDRLGSMIHHNYLRSLGPTDLRKGKRLARLLLKGQSLSNQAWTRQGFGYGPLGHSLQGWALATIRAKPLSEVQYTKVMGLSSSMRSAKTKLAELQTMMDLRVSDSEEFWMTLDLVKELGYEDGADWPEEWEWDKIQGYALPL